MVAIFPSPSLYGPPGTYQGTQATCWGNRKPAALKIFNRLFTSRKPFDGDGPYALRLPSPLLWRQPSPRVRGTLPYVNCRVYEEPRYPGTTRPGGSLRTGTVRPIFFGHDQTNADRYVNVQYHRSKA